MRHASRSPPVPCAQTRLRRKISRVTIKQLAPGANAMPRARRTKIDMSMPADGDPISLQRIYLRKIGRCQRLDVWVVDGSRIRNHIYDEFLEGGNDQRYRFVPPGEVWVDGATSVEEFEYSAKHELHE